MDYETVIGLEVHVQLDTRSKMFCSCRADYQAAPTNSRVCPVCLGLPGTLPVINRRAEEYTIMTGLALNCRVPDHSKFDWPLTATWRWKRTAGKTTSEYTGSTWKRMLQ